MRARAHTSSVLSDCIIIIIIIIISSSLSSLSYHHHHHLQPVHGDGVLVVAGVGAAHRLGPPHKLGVVAELEVELRGGAEAGQEHVLQVYKWGAARKNWLDSKYLSV